MFLECGDLKQGSALIRQVYETDPQICIQCVSEMKRIAFIEPWQTEVIEKILRNCGLWNVKSSS